MKDYREILSTWERYCRGLACRMAGVIDIETLAQEARVKIWLLAREYDGDDLARQIRISVPNHLLDVIRHEQKAKRDWRKTRSFERLREVGDYVVTIEAESFDAGIEDTVMFREGVARLLALVSDDERQVLDLLVDGGIELRDALLARSKGDHRIGPDVLAKVLGWNRYRAEQAKAGLQRKALIAFAA